MQLILTMTLKRLKFKLAPDQKTGIMPEATLRPKFGMTMRVEAV